MADFPNFISPPPKFVPDSCFVVSTATAGCHPMRRGAIEEAWGEAASESFGPAKARTNPPKNVAKQLPVFLLINHAHVFKAKDVVV